MSFLFAPTGDSGLGQQLGESDYGASAYGKTIPEIYGFVKIPTNLFWVGTVNSHSQSSGGKGGGGGKGGQGQTTYSGDFAVQMCRSQGPGPAIDALVQVWINGVSKYNASDYASAGALSASRNFIPDYSVLYYGTTTQVPDPTIAQFTTPGANYSDNSYVNYVNECPAYRGQAYLKFLDYPFESRNVPTVEVEVGRSPNCTLTTLPSGLIVVDRGDGMPVEDVITGILNGAGIASSYINIDLDGNTILVPGVRVYGDKRRETLGLLLQAFDIGFCESGYDLNFYYLYRNTVVNIPFSDLATVEGSRGSPSDPTPLVDTKESDLPFQLTLNYANNGLDKTATGTDNTSTNLYDTGTQIYQKSTGSATAIVTIDLGDFALDSATAAKIASKQLYRQWIKRLAISPARVPKKYMNLEAGDSFTTSFGGFDLTFLINKTTLGRDYSIEIEADLFNSITSVSPLSGSTARGERAGGDPTGTDVKLYMLNLPAMMSTQTNEGGFYVAANWSGGQGQPSYLYHSRDNGSSWSFDNEKVELPGSAITGTVTGVMPAAPIYGFDNVTSLVVTLDQPDINAILESIDEFTLFTGCNVAYVGTTIDNVEQPYNQFEIFQFLNVSLDVTKTIATFTGLLRGMKGTENYVDQHVVGEIFILLRAAQTTPGITFVKSQVRDVSTQQLWNIVAPGVEFGDGTMQLFTERDANLIPLNPRCFTGVTPTGSFEPTLRWWPRTRYDGDMLLPGGLPVGETTMAFRIYFYDPMGTKLPMTRDYTAADQLALPVTFTYTTTMRTEDFLSPTFDLTGYKARVVQMSTRVGAGNPTLRYFTFER